MCIFIDFINESGGKLIDYIELLIIRTIKAVNLNVVCEIPLSGVASLILMLTSAVSRVTSNSSGDDILAALESNSSGKFNHGPPNSLRSLASDALEDLREDARLPRCTCKNADRRLCQPPPGEDVCVISSTSSASLSFSFFRLYNFNFDS